MKKLILKLSFILLPIFFVSTTLEYAVRSIPNDYSYKNGYLTNYAEKIKVLVLGSSHSFFGINPDFFSFKSFNASYVSQSLDYDLFIFDKFEDKFSELQYIFLPISYFTLFSTLEDGDEDWRVKDYTIYYGTPSTLTSKYRFEMANGDYPKLLKKVYRHFTRAHSYITCSELGFGLSYSDKKQEDLEETGHAAAVRHTKNSLDKLEYNLEVLKTLMDKCEELNIKVVLFTPPAWRTYYNNLDAKQLSVMNKACVSIADTYSNVSYLNFLKDSRFSIEDFYDADHLNGIGAKKMTLILEKIISDIEGEITDHKQNQLSHTTRPI